MTPYNYFNYQKPFYPKSPNNYRGIAEDGRGLLLPFLVGAAVAFPIGYIASNTSNKNQQAGYPYPYPVYQQPYPMYQPNMGIPYQQMPYPQYPMPIY